MENEILERLAAYIDGRVSLDDFQAWLVSQTWDREAPQLAYEIELLLAEATSDHLSREELDAALREIARAAHLALT